MKKTLLSLALISALIISAFTGCSDDNEDSEVTDAPETTVNDTEADTEEATEADTTEADTTEADTEAEETAPVVKDYASIPDGLTAEKVGSFKKANLSEVGKGGMVYQDEDSGKYGVVSFDGKNDTGAIYAECEADGMYFVVSHKKLEAVENVSGLNIYGLIDGNGNVIVPEEYALFDSLSDKYVQAIKATEQTDSKDDYLLYYSTGIFSSIAASDDDILYKGYWEIFDTETGKKVPGVTASNAYSIDVTGDFIKFVSDDEEYVRVDSNGNVFDEDVIVFSNGCYMAYSGGPVYSADGAELFDPKDTGFVPYMSAGEYIVGRKTDGDVKSYILWDAQGNIVTAELTTDDYATPEVCGKLIELDGKVYDFDGNQIIDGEYEYIYTDELYSSAYMLRNGDSITFIDESGTVIYEGVKSTNMMFDYYSTFAIRKDNKYFCLADGDFAIEAINYRGCWMLEAYGINDTREIIDTISGKTLIEGYDRYTFSELCDGGYYIFAETESGAYDIYFVK
ncbi:MAG: hypothetical protein IJY93_03245 [Clostridia bacterium]|nr:hypothetical protein [Clostridia bacterium]